MVPLRKKVLKYDTPKPRKPVSLKGSTLAVLGLTVYGVFKILWKKVIQIQSSPLARNPTP